MAQTIPRSAAIPQMSPLLRFAYRGGLPSDTPQLRLQKALLVLLTSSVAVAVSFWGASYWALGYDFAAAVPLAYQIASIAGLVVFFVRRDFEAFRFRQLTLMLLLPFLMQWAVGGFANSGAAMLWAVLAPLSALLFDTSRGRVRWFLAFVVLTVVSGLLDGLAAERVPPMPAQFVVPFFVLNVAAVSTIAYVLVEHFAQERDAAQVALEREKERSEGLLLNVLPQPVAERLKEEEHAVIADNFRDATVLFADLVGFTTHAARTQPSAMVTLLNEVFTSFDRLAELHGLEKIKTIGDAYMAAAGVPGSQPDHAERVADMALDMLKVVEDFHYPDDGTQMQIRIGIHSGPVVAGVIGEKKYIYDLWGDTVNTASRMESHGVPGFIQVTEDCWARLKDRYEFTERGTIDVKGKGELRTYLLMGRAGRGPATRLGQRMAASAVPSDRPGAPERPASS